MTVSDHQELVKPPRRRLSTDEMRRLILQEARDLVIAKGPQAVTLKAVAERVGVTHGNVTHHFGTVATLHTALISAILEDLTLATAAAVAHLRQGEMDTGDVVNVVFGAFATGGAGRLVVWLAATGAGHRLAPFYAIIADLVGCLAGSEAGQRVGGSDSIGLMMAMLVTPALGDSLIGADLEKALGLQRHAVRQITAKSLTTLRSASVLAPNSGAAS